MNFSIHEAIARQYELLETVVKTGSQRLQDVGLIASGEVIEGKPVPVLLRESKEWGADAIFIGARGHGFFERFLLGSVSASLAARAHCSVEIIRTDQPKEKQ
jgi:nucleotide-binding universal stress UspA family protein